MMRFQHLLPAFIGFFIVGAIIGLLIQGIGLSIILGLIIGAAATAVFWQFAQAGSFPQSAGSVPGAPSSIPTRASGSSKSVEDVLESEASRKREKPPMQPARGMKPQPAQQNMGGDEPLEPSEMDWLADAEFEEESTDDDEFFDGTISREVQEPAQQAPQDQKEVSSRATTNRQTGKPSTGTLPPPPPPHMDEPESPNKPEPPLPLEEVAQEQAKRDSVPDTTPHRLSRDDSKDKAVPMQPQPRPPSPPSSTTPLEPDPEPVLDADKPKSIDDEWVPVDETAEEKPSKEREKETAVAAEDVQFTLYHPKDAAAEQWYSLLTYIHVESAIAAVQADAKKFTAELTHDHRKVRSRKSAKLTRGTEIRLVPFADGLEFNPSSIAITWVEDFHRADFRFRASNDLIGEPALGELTIYVGPLEIANLRFSIFVTDAAAATSDSSPETHAVQTEMYKRIFASYSHADTPVVKACVAAFKAIGYEVLIDYETLRSGEDWSEALERLIDEADIFQLFWSTNAARSKFVQQEWEYALKRPINNSKLKAGEGFIRPVYWEQPTPNIPESLSHIHFKYLADLANLDK